MEEVLLHAAGHPRPHSAIGRQVGMSGDVHHRAEGDVTGLGAASRAGAHVSCATGQESVIVSAYESEIPPI
jgi:hypothetical protein